MVATFDLAKNPNLQEMRSAFFVDGVFVLRNLFPLDEVNLLVDELRATLLFSCEKRGISVNGDDSLDNAFNALWDGLGEERSNLRTIGKDLASFWGLVGNQKLTGVLKQLYDCETLQTVADSDVLRVDRPNDDSTSLTWHQDFPYNVLSRQACTIWSPLLPVTEKMGPMVFSPRALDVMPVFEFQSEKSVHHSSSYYQLRDLEALEREAAGNSVQMPIIEPGDAIFSHCLLLHASGKNRSKNKSRWVFTARYSPMQDEESEKRLWLTARDKYPFFFSKQYPEYVTKVASE